MDHLSAITITIMATRGTVIVVPFHLVNAHGF
jgi:hypothetical protein